MKGATTTAIKSTTPQDRHLPSELPVSSGRPLKYSSILLQGLLRSMGLFVLCVPMVLGRGSYPENNRILASQPQLGSKLASGF